VSNDGENMLKLVKQMKQLCEQVSLLLRTADEQMRKADWKEEGNVAISDSSASIDNPERWIPIAVFRFYRNGKHPNHLAYVSILLDDHWEGEYTIKEPLVTAGFFDYGQEKVGNVWSNWQYWFARYYGYLSAEYPNLMPDGQPFHFDPRTAQTGDWGEFKSAEVFALPLTSITNADDVASKITSKLISLTRKEE